MKRTAMYPLAVDTNDIQKTVGADNIIRNAQPYLGPNRSQIAPIHSLENILPDTDATPALPMSCLTKLRLSRIIGTNGAAANVETKQVKNEIHER